MANGQGGKQAWDLILSVDGRSAWGEYPHAVIHPCGLLEFFLEDLGDVELTYLYWQRQYFGRGMNIVQAIAEIKVFFEGNPHCSWKEVESLWGGDGSIAFEVFAGIGFTSSLRSELAALKARDIFHKHGLKVSLSSHLQNIEKRIPGRVRKN